MIKNLPPQKSLEYFRHNKLVLKESSHFEVGAFLKASIELFASKNQKYKRTPERIAKEQVLELEINSKRDAIFKPEPVFTVLNKRELRDEDEAYLPKALDYFGFVYEVFIRLPSPPKPQVSWTDTVERKTNKSHEWAFECVSFGYSTSVLAFNLSHRRFKNGQFEKAKELAEQAWLSMELVASILKECFNWSSFKGDLSKEMVETLRLYFKAHIPLIMAYSCYYAEENVFETKETRRKRKIDLWNCSFTIMNDAQMTFMASSKLVHSCPTLRNSILLKRQLTLFNFLLESAKDLKRVHKKDILNDNLTGSKCGMAVAYLGFLHNSMQGYIKEHSKQLDHHEMSVLNAMASQAAAKHKQYEDWNNEVFKQPTTFQITIQNFFPTTAAQRSLFDVHISHSFQVFPEVPETLLRTLRQFDSQRASGTENRIEQIKAEMMATSVKDRVEFEERFTKVCSDLNIDMHTNHVQHPAKKEVSESVVNKFKKLEMVYGKNAHKFFALRDSLEKWRHRGAALIKSLQEKIEEERKLEGESSKEYETAKKEGGIACQDLQKYTQKMTTQVLEYLNSEVVKNQIENFLKGPEAIMSKIPKNIDEKLVEFYSSNPELMNDLVQKKRKLDDEFAKFVKAQEVFVANLKKINGRLIIGHLVISPESMKQIIEHFREDVMAVVAVIDERKAHLEKYLRKLEEVCQKIMERMNPSQSALFLTQSKVFTNDFGDFDVIMALPKKLARLSSQCESTILKALNVEGSLTNLIRQSELEKEETSLGNFENEDCSWMDSRCSIQSVHDATVVESIVCHFDEYPTN